MYLHGIMIIFRDMKPENVLIFSTSMDATVSIWITKSVAVITNI